MVGLSGGNGGSFQRAGPVVPNARLYMDLDAKATNCMSSYSCWNRGLQVQPVFLRNYLLFHTLNTMKEKDC